MLNYSMKANQRPQSHNKTGRHRPCCLPYNFYICNYVFKLHWAVTLSICIIYTTSFDKGLQSVFPLLAGQNDEETPEI